jgi:hypothetical protein
MAVFLQLSGWDINDNLAKSADFGEIIVAGAFGGVRPRLVTSSEINPSTLPCRDDKFRGGSRPAARQYCGGAISVIED